MFLLRGGSLVTSPSDLKLASECEFAFLRLLDYRLGRVEGLLEVDDPLLERAGQLGAVHENAQLSAYRARYGAGVVEIPSPESRDAEALRRAAAQTVAALRSGADVVCQGVFFDERDPARPVLGYADFLLRRPDGRYRVQDTKLARTSKRYMHDQLAIYHEQLGAVGVPADELVEVLLGDGTSVEHPIDELRAGLAARRTRMHALIDEHRAESGAIAWGDDRYLACGRCPQCGPEAAAADDVIQVAGLTRAHRAKLRACGIATLAALAAAAAPPAGCAIPPVTYAKLQHQARLQHATARRPEAGPAFEVIDAEIIHALPKADPGDLYFDFEGDPMSSETTADGIVWDLDYLWGVVDTAGEYTAYWAHSLGDERLALLAFLDHVEGQRAAHPAMHVYHYANYEIVHLRKIARRHGVAVDRVEALVAAGVFVDLLPVVRGGVRIGLPSYSLKKIEPLYLPAARTAEGVTTAVGSVVEYWQARELRDAGDHAGAEAVLARIAAYNRDDCVSTMRLREWLEQVAG